MYTNTWLSRAGAHTGIVPADTQQPDVLAQVQAVRNESRPHVNESRPHVKGSRSFRSDSPRPRMDE